MFIGFFSNTVFCQQNRVFSDQQLAHPKSMYALINFPSLLGTKSSQLAGLETRNLYLQTKENVLTGFYYRGNAKRKWGLVAQREGNSHFSHWSFNAVCGLRLTERFNLGVLLGGYCQRFPEWRQYGYSWELNGSYSSEKSLILFWYRSNGHRDLFSNRPNAGVSFSYFIDESFMVQSTIQLQSYRPPRWNVMLFQSDDQSNWFLAIQFNPMGGSIGFVRQLGKFTMLYSVYYGLLPFPCLQMGGIYEK